MDAKRCPQKRYGLELRVCGARLEPWQTYCHACLAERVRFAMQAVEEARARLADCETRLDVLLALGRPPGS